MTGLIGKATGRFSETEVDDEIVVMSLDSGDFFSLTDTARAIWQLLDVPRDRETLVADLARQFAVPADALSADVDAFLAQLAGADLIRVG